MYYSHTPAFFSLRYHAVRQTFLLSPLLGEQVNEQAGVHSIGNFVDPQMANSLSHLTQSFTALMPGRHFLFFLIRKGSKRIKKKIKLDGIPLRTYHPLHAFLPAEASAQAGFSSFA
jgi:hypothetical protein